MYLIHAVISTVLAIMAKRPQHIPTTGVPWRPIPIYWSQWSKSNISHNKGSSTAEPYHITTQLWYQRGDIPGNDKYTGDVSTRLFVYSSTQSAAVLRCNWSVLQLHGIWVIIWAKKLIKSRTGITTNYPGHQHHVSPIQSDCFGSPRVSGIGVYGCIPFSKLFIWFWSYRPK